MARRALIAACVAAAAAVAVGCAGRETVKVAKSDPTYPGAKLFAERCGGCHTMKAAGTQGSTTRVSDKEEVDGPNFNDRPETVDDVVYAIQNGGFSGAIMPENIATGEQARQIAEFVAKYAGPQAPQP